jgi:hypothetical protein
MQDKIYRMISGRLIPIAKDCLVEKIGKCCERTIKTRFPCRPPIGVSENKRDIFWRDFTDARIKEKPLVIEHEPGLK